MAFPRHPSRHPRHLPLPTATHCHPPPPPTAPPTAAHGIHVAHFLAPWAFRHPTAPMAPFQADARTAYFGKGSKASAFYFGTSVGVHTCDGSKGDPKQSVLMMTIDGEKMEERTKAGNCVDTYAPGPPYSTCGLRVPASCVLPAAGGAGQHAGGCTYFYACQPRAYRTTAYCGTTGGKGRVGTGASLPR